MILTFILNFTNIYSQSNNYIYTWYNESIGTLYLDKQLLESSANALSQYLGPLAPIILENLPYIVTFLALLFIFRRLLNIFNSLAPESQKLLISALISLILTYLFWPFVMPILITAFVIKVFRVGKSKLESLRETLGKIDPRLGSIFSRITSNIRNFDKGTKGILKDINILYRIINHPYIRRLLNSIEKDIKTLNNIISQLEKETENERLTQHMLMAYSSKFNMIYNNAKYKIEQLSRIINTMFSNISLLRRFGNRIFKTNKFTPKFLMELRNILKDLNERLNSAYTGGQNTFKYLNILLGLANVDSGKLVVQINNELKRDANVLSYLGNQGKPMIREVQTTENTVTATYKDWRISPFKKLKTLYKVSNSTEKLSKILRKFRGNPKRLLKDYKKAINLSKHILKNLKIR
jgi:transposase-like protein